MKRMRIIFSVYGRISNHLHLDIREADQINGNREEAYSGDQVILHKAKAQVENHTSAMFVN